MLSIHSKIHEKYLRKSVMGLVKALFLGKLSKPGIFRNVTSKSEIIPVQEL